jgi:flagellar capping protein FliD
MAYASFGTSKWHCFRDENKELPLLERKNPVKSIFVVSGAKSFSYEDIKLRGVNSCVGDIKRIIKEGKLGPQYKEFFIEVDDQYFSNSDYDMLTAYFNQFMKEIYETLNPVIKKTPIFGVSSIVEKKAQIEKKRTDLTKQIEDMQKELKQTEEEASGIDLDAINSEVQGDDYINPASVPPVE